MRHSSALVVIVAAFGAILVVNACGGSKSPGGTGCPGEQTECGSLCVDTMSDPTNCGGCGAACTVTMPFCQAGQCVATCGQGYVACGSGCVDTVNDPDNCGVCGHACAINEACSSSQCVAGACRGSTCGQLCVDTSTDPANCGSCGNACPVTAPICVAGGCSATCPTALLLCTGKCVNAATDPSNCGGCGNVCESGVCTNGHCACDAGQMDCGAGCVDITANPNRCGECTNRCDATQFCTASTCECRPGLVAGNNRTCTDPNSNPAACGGGAPCGQPTPLCQNGGCVATCTNPDTQCGQSCVDLQNDPLHCGGCDRVCENNQVCVQGECRGYRAAVGCTTCPCTECQNNGGSRCCRYPGDPSFIVCVSADACPQ